MFMKWWTAGSSNKEALHKAHQLRRATRKAALLLLAVPLFASGCSLLPAEDVEEQLPAIAPPQIAQKPEYEVTTTTIESKVNLIGKLIAPREETVYFTLEGKRLKTLNIELGDSIAAGAVIGELDVDDMQRELRTKRLQFRSAEIRFKETLRQRDEMDPVEFEQAAIAFEEQRQAISDLEEEIGKAVLTAPIGGTVVSVRVEKGDLLQAYAPVAVIADTSELLVAATIAKERLGEVAVGMPVVVEINNAGQFQGKVRQLPVPRETSGENPGGGSGGNPGGGSGGGGGGSGGNSGERPEDFLIIDLDEMPDDLNRGTPLSASITTNRKENVVVIPIAALRSVGSRTYVQVVEADGSKREVDVGVGQQTSTQVEILEGLTPGQKVVGR